jgi:putative ABC transport system permease protein
MVLHLAIRNLILLRKRYILLFFAVLIGFILITIITGIVFGAMNTIKDKAARYFAGHTCVVGFNAARMQEIRDPDSVISYLQARVPGIRSISPRTIYYRPDCTMFFSGQTIRQRRLVGMDFEREQEEFRSLQFSSGGVEDMLGEKGEHGILISKTAAKLLGARVGDDINIFLTTGTGQYNSATLLVRGIFNETSLFGYVAYMRRQDLNALVGTEKSSATDIAIYVKNGFSQGMMTKRVREKLGDRYKVFPPLASREELTKVANSFGLVNDTFAVLSLDAYLAQIKDILGAIVAITYFVLSAFVLIVMIGIVNTYRVLVYERTKEIGAMRALGMQRRSVTRLFLWEAGGLGFLASIVGLILGSVILILISLIDFGFLPAAGLFTNSGRLGFSLDIGIISGNVIAMTVAVMCAALGPARNAGKIAPVDALRGYT